MDDLLADRVNCDSILVKSLVIEHYDNQTKLAWTSLIDYETAKEKTSHMTTDFQMGLEDWLGIVGHSDNDNYAGERQRYLDDKRFSLDVRESRQLLISQLRPDQVESWSKCVHDKLKLPGIVCYVDAIDEDGGVLNLTWNLSEDATQLQNVKVTIDSGGTINNKAEFALSRPLQGSAVDALRIKRGKRNGRVVGEVRGHTAGGGGHYAKFVLPELVARRVFSSRADGGTADAVSLAIGPYPFDVSTKVYAYCTQRWEEFNRGPHNFTWSVQGGGIDDQTRNVEHVVPPNQEVSDRKEFDLLIAAGDSVRVVAHLHNSGARNIQFLLEQTSTKKEPA